MYQVRDWLFLPPLEITSPIDGGSSEGPAVRIEGVSTPGVELTINGIKTYSDETGHFSTEFLLPDGIHTIQVIAKNRFGREQILKHTIVVVSS